MLTKTIPNLFTIANLSLGILAIILAFNNRPDLAALMVIIAVLTDGLDGKLARALNAQSEFGKELDSLSDVISFGVAPAFMMYVVAFQHLGAIGWAVTVLFPTFGALRLARFNVANASPGYFIGLPIPAAGGLLSLLALFQAEISPFVMLVCTVLLAMMMVSRFQYPSFKKAGISNKIVWFAGVLFVFGAITAHALGRGEYAKFLLIPLALYAIYGLKKNVRLLLRRKKKELYEVDDSVRL